MLPILFTYFPLILWHLTFPFFFRSTTHLKWHFVIVRKNSPRALVYQIRIKRTSETAQMWKTENKEDLYFIISKMMSSPSKLSSRSRKFLSFVSDFFLQLLLIKIIMITPITVPHTKCGMWSCTKDRVPNSATVSMMLSAVEELPIRVITPFPSESKPWVG